LIGIYYKEMVASLSAAPRHTNPSLWLLKKQNDYSFLHPGL